MASATPRAVTIVGDRSAQQHAASLARLTEALGSVADESTVEELVAGVRRNTRLTLNFHPDRRGTSAPSVAEGLLLSGRYLPQAETGLSNGSRSAVPGGERTNWERELFGDTYETEGVDRPVYGALDLTRDPHGGSPRFGSCFVILNEPCFDRATFCVGDSHSGPTDIGTIDSFDAILAGLFEQGLAGSALDRGLTIADLRTVIAGGAPHGPPARCLDGYIEAQIHGGVSLIDDVEAIVADPSFHGTEIGAHLAGGAEAYDFDLRWHAGSELEVASTPADFRGRTMPTLAQEVARPDGIVDAATIGRHAAGISFTPPIVDGDPPESELQQIKYLWHCVLAFGRDAATRQEPPQWGSPDSRRLT